MEIFEETYLKNLGFLVVSDDGQYGRAESIRPKGYCILEWNRKGYSKTYLGEPLEPNVCLGIRLDGGTRTAFNGLVRDRETLELLLTLCR